MSLVFRVYGLGFKVLGFMDLAFEGTRFRVLVYYLEFISLVFRV